MSQAGLRRTYPLGIFRASNAPTLIGREKYSETFRLVLGHDRGQGFQLQTASPSIMLPLGRKEHLAHITDVRISQVLDQQIMTYTAHSDSGRKLHLAIHDEAEGMDIWRVPALNHHLAGSGMLVPEYQLNGHYALYYGDRSLQVAMSKNLVAWHTGGRALAEPRPGVFDHSGLNVLSATTVSPGILVLYSSTDTKKGRTTLAIGAALFAKTDPEKLLWRTEAPLHEHTATASQELRALGAMVTDYHITLYFSTKAEKIIDVTVPNPYAPQGHGRHANRLHRTARNPILSPTFNEWESQAVFNPAAFSDNGRVHLLYRAMGPDGISRLGYASSADGIHFDERLPYPVFMPRKGFGAPSKKRRGTELAHYDLKAHPSGGGWAGCEDPRVVTIDDQAYLSFVAFDGWEFVRQAITSISLKDLHKHKWKWRKPVLLSPPGEIQKNWVLFPEKINGRFAILHGISPRIHVEYVDSLDDFDCHNYIKSLPQVGGHGYHDPKRQHHWDNMVRGAGAPPLKTPLGWLQLYHAIDRSDPGRYKIGAMILDENDPTKVLFRTNQPILAPDEWYENDGKPGVIYTCGAVIVDNDLIVYYGGGDKRIAAARANVEHFLNALAAGSQASLESVELAVPNKPPARVS